MERLSGLDATFLYTETPSMHLHVAMTAILDTATMPEPYAFERTKDFIAQRLLLVPVFRRRIVEVPFRVGHPIWVEDPNLDLDYHIRRHALPQPAGLHELADLVGHLVSFPLDRARPLWEVHLIEGLPDQQIALVAKIHHCAVDGVSGAELFVHLFDLTPEGREVQPVPPVQPEHIPSDAELVSHAVVSWAKRTARLPMLVGRTAASVGTLVRRHRDPSQIVGAVPLTAPRTPFNGSITPHRRVAFARVKLDDVKEVKNAFGVKVNDVVLALMSGTLRRYLAGRDALPAESLVATCPVSVRSEDERGVQNNRISAMFTHLHTDVDDVGRRIRAIAASTTGAKEDHHAIGAKFLQNWAEHAAPATFALAMRVYSGLNLADRHRPLHNVLISNVPGPPFPVYCTGARLVATYPMGPIMEGAGLNVTVLSYIDNVDIGFMACRELVPDVWDLATHVTEAMDELLTAAAVPGRRAPKSARHGGSKPARKPRSV